MKIKDIVQYNGPSIFANHTGGHEYLFEPALLCIKKLFLNDPVNAYGFACVDPDNVDTCPVS